MVWAHLWEGHLGAQVELPLGGSPGAVVCGQHFGRVKVLISRRFKVEKQMR